MLVECPLPPHRPVHPECSTLPQSSQCLIQQAQSCAGLPTSKEFSGKYIHTCMYVHVYVQYTCTCTHMQYAYTYVRTYTCVNCAFGDCLTYLGLIRKYIHTYNVHTVYMYTYTIYTFVGGNGMYKKTYYEMCISPHMPSYSTNHNLVQGISKCGAKWQETFEATYIAFVCYSCDNFQQISYRAQTGMYV